MKNWRERLKFSCTSDWPKLSEINSKSQCVAVQHVPSTKHSYKAQQMDALFSPVNHHDFSRLSTWDNLCSCQPWATGALRGKVSTVASAHIFIQQQFMERKAHQQIWPRGMQPELAEKGGGESEESFYCRPGKRRGWWWCWGIKRSL